MSKVLVTGAPVTQGPNGTLPIRREIRDLESNFKDQWNLYILGLVDLQKQQPAELLSYYQLAGIHGEPYVPWSGVAGNQNASFGGYCTHSSILFATWHRPYLAIYEQTLYASIQRIASSFPEAIRARYVSAAKDFRIPYWDWAARVTGQASVFPISVSSPSIKVIDIDGVSKRIDNPLYSFQFSDKEVPKKLALDNYWNQFGTTLRAPDQNGISQDALVSRVVANENASLRTNVSLVLLSYKQFDAFTNNLWLRNEQPGTYGSLEDMHNEIHDKIGQGGHMSALEVSAFDPVFWLHHTNVDRLWAIWQGINPDAYIIDKVAQSDEANFYITTNMRLNASTSLKPFYDPSGTTFWDSSKVKLSTALGYDYSETLRAPDTTEQAYQAALRKKVTDLYGANTINNFFANIAPANIVQASTSAQKERIIPTTAGAPRQGDAKDFVNKVVTHAVQITQRGATSGSVPAESSKMVANGATNGADLAEFSNMSHSTPVPLNVPEQFVHLVPNRTYTEWITNLRAIKHGLSQTFRVYVFLGDFSSNPIDWPTEYNVVGRFTVLGRGGETQCEKCQQDRDDELVVTGTVPLTSALLQDIVEGRLASLEPEVVEPYLERNLHWRVTLFDGSERERNDVPGLKVSVVSTRVRIGDDGVPIHSGVYDQYPGITDGRPAGLGSGEPV